MLAERGHSVTWWTSNFFHTTKEFRCNGQKDYHLNANLRIIVVDTAKYIKNIGVARIRSQYLYARRFFRLAKTLPRPDIILASVPPLYSVMLSIKFAESCGARVIADVQDLWPDGYDIILPRTLKPFTNHLFFPVTAMALSVYRNAHGIMSMSETFLNRALKAVPLSEKKPKFVLYLGMDLDYFDSTAEDAEGVEGVVRHNEGSLVAIYAGMIGGASDIYTILGAAQKLKGSQADVKFVISGAGPLLGDIEQRCQTARMDNVFITGFLDYPRLKYLLMRSSAGLVAYGRGVKSSFPNKPYDYMAAGLPLVNSIEGEFEEIVKREGLGLQYEAGNPSSLAEALTYLYENQPARKEMGQKARRLVEQNFDRKTIYPRIVDFMEEVLSVGV
jgi:glycosyltransferase involved in cell wall biosynthesis